MQSFRLLARPDQAPAVAERCFQETLTIGLRLRDERRLILPRAGVVVGGVGGKTVSRPGGRSTAKAESDDLDGDSLAARRKMKRDAEGGGDG